MSLLTVVRKNDLKKNAMQQIGVLHKETNVPDKDLVIADIGANIGYYAESFLHFYPNSIVHAYEPHPLHIEELNKLNEARITVHPYGLWNCDKQMTIGMRSDGKMNNGTYEFEFSPGSGNPTGLIGYIFDTDADFFSRFYGVKRI